MAIAASTQTIHQGIGEIVASTGAYNLPASGRGEDVWGTRRLFTWTLTAVTLSSGLLGFDPHANGMFGPIGVTWAVYQAGTSTDHLYAFLFFDPVNTNYVF